METNFIDMRLVLSDGSMRELHVESGEYKIARPEWDYDMDDFELFLSYIRNAFIGNISKIEAMLSDEGIQIIADMLEAYLLGQWVVYPESVEPFLDRKIGEGVRIINIWSITTPDIDKPEENADWLWLTNQLLLP